MYLEYSKNNAKMFDRGESFMQRNLYEHFMLPGHSGFLYVVSITLTEKIDPSYSTNAMIIG